MNLCEMKNEEKNQMLHQHKSLFIYLLVLSNLKYGVTCEQRLKRNIHKGQILPLNIRTFILLFILLSILLLWGWGIETEST